MDLHYLYDNSYEASNYVEPIEPIFNDGEFDENEYINYYLSDSLSTEYLLLSPENSPDDSECEYFSDSEDNQIGGALKLGGLTKGMSGLFSKAKSSASDLASKAKEAAQKQAANLQKQAADKAKKMKNELLKQAQQKQQQLQQQLQQKQQQLQQQLQQKQQQTKKQVIKPPQEKVPVMSDYERDELQRRKEQ